jgi:hypothetical protein
VSSGDAAGASTGRSFYPALAHKTQLPFTTKLAQLLTPAPAKPPPLLHPMNQRCRGRRLQHGGQYFSRIVIHPPPGREV